MTTTKERKGFSNVAAHHEDFRMSQIEKTKIPGHGKPSPPPGIPYSFGWELGLESPRSPYC
jgi:hypothetical protein